jgi:hypothetical protein
MVISLLRFSPPLSQPTSLYSPCWLNGRRYLHPSSAFDKYIPICQSFAPIIFPDLESLAVEKIPTREALREKLIAGCKIATEQYAQLKNRKSVLPESIALMESLGAMMGRKSKHAAEQNNRPEKADPVSAACLGTIINL